MGRNRRRRDLGLEERARLVGRWLFQSRCTSEKKRKRGPTEAGSGGTKDKQHRVNLQPRPILPRVQDASNHDARGLVRTNHAYTAPGVRQAGSMSPIKGVPGQAPDETSRDILYKDEMFKPATPDSTTGRNNPFIGGVPQNHNFTPPLPALDNFHDGHDFLEADFGSAIHGAFTAGPFQNVDHLIPRRTVQVLFEDADKQLRNFAAVFDPESEVSFACRPMVTDLGKKSLPWKPVPIRQYTTLAGLIAPPEWAIIRLKAPECGIDRLYPLRVAVLDDPGGLFPVDFCFGRPAIEQMVLEFDGFKNALHNLCGSLADTIDREPDDDDDRQSSQYDDSFNDGSRPPPPKRPRVSHLGQAPLTPLQRRAYPLSPSLTQCTTSDSKFAMQLVPSPLAQYMPVSMSDTNSLAASTTTLWTSNNNENNNQQHVGGTCSSPVDSNVDRCQYLPPPPSLFTTPSGGDVTLADSVGYTATTQPLSSVGYTSMPAMSFPYTMSSPTFPGLPHGLADEADLD